MKKDISGVITAKRTQKGLNKARLATLLGISSAAVGQYENGKSYPKIEILFELSKILNWDFINDKPLESEDLSSRHKEVTYKENLNQRASDFGFSDVKSVNQNATYLRNSTFPEDKPQSELWQLIDNQQQQIRNLMQQVSQLSGQVEIMYKLIPKS